MKNQKGIANKTPILCKFNAENSDPNGKPWRPSKTHIRNMQKKELKSKYDEKAKYEKCRDKYSTQKKNKTKKKTKQNKPNLPTR